MNEFGEFLKSLRKEKKVTQRDLADKVGVDFSYISKIETGALEPPSEKVILEMARILDADAEKMVLLANKIPTSFAKKIQEDNLAEVLLRKVTGLTNEQKDAIRKIIDED